MNFPNNTHRHAIIGRTGSGKTVAALWALQKRNYDKMPWIIFDWKGDENIGRIPGLNNLKISAKLPTRAGLYRVQPLPEIDDGAVDDMMWRILERGRTGVYVDEGYMISQYNKSYRAILTQGRSKKIPVITLSQAPAHINAWILRESEFIQCFHLQNPNDQKRMHEFIPGFDVSTIPRFHSIWYDVIHNEKIMLGPVPDVPTIMERYADKRAPRGWRL